MPSFCALGRYRAQKLACTQTLQCKHARTYTQPIALNKSMPPLGWTGIISSRWFMMEMGNVFAETTWVTSFSRPENKYRPLYHTIAQASVVLASHHCVSHTSLTPLEGAAHPLCPRCPCEICVRWCNCNRVHLHGNVLAAVKCVYSWNGSCCQRPALPPERRSLGWYICTRDISQHQHLAPGFSYDFSSCRSFVLPLVTLWPMIHTHKDSLKSKTPASEPTVLLKEATFLHAMTNSLGIPDHKPWTDLFH